MGYAGVNISLSYTGGTGDLNVLAEPQNCGTGAGEVDCSDYALVVLPRWAWFRNGKTTISNSTGTIVLTPMGMPSRTITMTHPPSDYAFPQLEGYDHMAVGLGNGAVGMQEDAAGKPTAASIGKVVAAARKKEYASYEKYGALADVKEAVQAATMWNYIYTPAEYGPVRNQFIGFHRESAREH